MQGHTIAEVFAIRHGGPLPRWSAWLKQHGLPPTAVLVQLTGAQRSKLQGLFAQGLPPFACQPALAPPPLVPPTVVQWARLSTANYVKTHRPWLLTGSDDARLGQWLATERYVGVDGERAPPPPQVPLPQDDPFVMALRSTGLAANSTALRVWALLETAARHHPLAHTLLALHWTGVARAVPLRLAVAIAEPSFVGQPQLPAERIEVLPSRQGELLRLRGAEPATAAGQLPPTVDKSAAQVAGLLQRLAPLPLDIIALTLSTAGELALRELKLRWQYREVTRQIGGSGGLIALLSGSAGHGRRTAARLLAADLGMELLRVQAGLLASRWIGETEKRISHMFSQAANTGAALLVEDANDLFSRHVAANSANDRYANAVRNHLLQEIENFSGLVLLIANGPHQFDAAMQRRIHVTVRFDAPDRLRRSAILHSAWQWVVQRSPAIFPDQQPDFDEFSSREATPQQLVQAVLEAGMQALYDGDTLDDHRLASVLRHRIGYGAAWAGSD
ncbi:MAG: AAA family ATPase [Myxococcales bacterium]|nr:AAA family ATPase [Myxococcales bacterium]